MTPIPQQSTFYIIPHTHWEGAVFKTREQYLDIGLPNILRALALLDAHPTYRFTLDQTCYIEAFLERYPEHEAAFRQLVHTGRLAIVGGTHVMPDVNMPAGESFVRQVLYAKTYLRDKLGIDVTVGWQLDAFGHHAQMPQLLRLAGYRSFWFFRGVASPDTPARFQWEGIDGSRIPAFWLPHGYAFTYASPRSLSQFCQFMEERFDGLAPFESSQQRVGLAGADVSPPEEHLPLLVEEFNRMPSARFQLRIGTPTEYEEAVGEPSDLPVIPGELDPVFQGTYSSRIELKQCLRGLENSLITAEKLGVLLRAFGATVSDENLWQAWERVLFNEAHDLMSGVMTDHVYEDTVRGYDCARRVADHEIRRRITAYSSAIDTVGDGVPVLVFNSLGWTRTDLAVIKVGFAEDEVAGVRLVGPDGQPVPAQILRCERHENGSLIDAEIALLARDVPALGHCLYRVLPEHAAASAVTPAEAAPLRGVIENEMYRLEFDVHTGAMTQIVCKADAWDVLSSPGNIVVQEPDRGDLWELYRPLDGGSRFAMEDQHPIRPRGEAIFSDEQRADPAHAIVGPVVSQFSVEHPFGAEGLFRTQVRLCSGLPRIEVRTQILNNDDFVRYRAVFPTTIADGRSVHEIPFGAIERPCGIEFPAQNWVDYGDGKRGVALLNRGIPGNAVANGTMILSLCRSTRIVAYGFGGGYEPGMSSDSGLERGKLLTFDYGLLPHSGDWRDAAAYRHALEFNNPLMVSTAASHAGALPGRWGYLDVTPPNVVVSTLKPLQDGAAVLRVYEAAGRATPGARLRLPAAVRRVQEVDLMENPICELSAANDSLAFDLRAFEIKTIKLHCQPPGSRPPRPEAARSST